MLRKVFFAASVALLLASTASAATINYTLDLSVPNVWQVRAQTTGANGGIATYGIPIVGNILSMDHRTPVAFVTTPAFGVSGFSNLRTADVTAAQSGVSIGAAQALGAANIVYGFGSVAGSYATQTPPQTFGGPGGADTTFDQVWTAPAVIANGTYNSAAGSLTFGPAGPDLFANLFAQSGTDSRVGADGVTTTIIPLIPEPATISLLGLAMVGALGLFRRHRAA